MKKRKENIYPTNKRINGICDALQIHPASFVYANNSYTALGIEALKKMQRGPFSEDLYVLSEDAFSNVYFLLQAVYEIIATGNASVLIISRRKVIDSVSAFFISDKARLHEWNTRIKTNNSGDLNRLWNYYYHWYCHENLTRRELKFLNTIKNVNSRTSTGSRLHMNNKQVSHYYVSIKKKLGVANNVSLLGYMKWLSAPERSHFGQETR